MGRPFAINEVLVHEHSIHIHIIYMNVQCYRSIRRIVSRKTNVDWESVEGKSNIGKSSATCVCNVFPESNRANIVRMG